MAQSEDLVTLERRGDVAILRLNRPKSLNAIDLALCTRLSAHLSSLDGDTGVGAVVLAGAGGRAFSAGADLALITALSGAEKRRFVETAWRTLDDLARLPLPTIAAIDGYALGGGLELALACDLRVAHRDAVMGLPEMDLGSVPSFGAIQRLPGIVGRGRALELVLSGRRIGAAEAERIGLVGEIAAHRSVDSALELAERLASRPAEAVRYLKLALSLDGAGQDAAGLHGMISDICHRAPGYAERTARFRRDE